MIRVVGPEVEPCKPSHLARTRFSVDDGWRLFLVASLTHVFRRMMAGFGWIGQQTRWNTPTLEHADAGTRWSWIGHII